MGDGLVKSVWGLLITLSLLGSDPCKWSCPRLHCAHLEKVNFFSGGASRCNCNFHYCFCWQQCLQLLKRIISLSLLPV
jgi:hypothetical protein